MKQGRPPLERALDWPERLALALPLSANARIFVRGSFGFLKQLLRSRALRLRRPGRPEAAPDPRR